MYEKYTRKIPPIWTFFSFVRKVQIMYEKYAHKSSPVWTFPQKILDFLHFSTCGLFSAKLVWGWLPPLARAAYGTAKTGITSLIFGVEKKFKNLQKGLFVQILNMGNSKGGSRPPWTPTWIRHCTTIPKLYMYINHVNVILLPVNDTVTYNWSSIQSSCLLFLQTSNSNDNKPPC